MLSNRQLFLQHLAQTSDFPLMLEIERAEGIYLYDTNNKPYIDLISGISVSNLGHRHPKVVEAIKNQVDKYMHLMVYGEYVQTPQVQLAELLASQLPDTLNTVYFVNSGSEATEGAIKLARRYSGRCELISFVNSYHGSTLGSLSIMGNEEYKKAFQPLLSDTKLLRYNNFIDLQQITEKTACVVIEPIQGEAGVVLPQHDFLKAVRKRCTQTGTLLIFDEIQTGFGRTGTLFGFQNFDVIPDIFTIAKGMGGGMPIGAFISSKEIMDVFKNNPILGHITTFGGHPVCCAASHATLKVLLESNLINEVVHKEQIFRKQLIHPRIKEIRSKGLFFALELGDFDTIQRFIKQGIKNGILCDWFFFNDTFFRLAPPLIITEEQIHESCRLILKTLDEL